MSRSARLRRYPVFCLHVDFRPGFWDGGTAHYRHTLKTELFSLLWLRVLRALQTCFAGTWRKPQGAGGNLWLRDNLPQAIPNARVFLYEYESSTAFGSTKERFVYQANDLLENLRIERRKVGTCREFVYTHRSELLQTPKKVLNTRRP